MEESNETKHWRWTRKIDQGVFYQKENLYFFCERRYTVWKRHLSDEPQGKGLASVLFLIASEAKEGVERGLGNDTRLSWQI